MREEIGGVDYDDEAKLKFGSPEKRADFSAAKNLKPRAELLLRIKNGRNENSNRKTTLTIWRIWKNRKKRRGCSRCV